MLTPVEFSDDFNLDDDDDDDDENGHDGDDGEVASTR